MTTMGDVARLLEEVTDLLTGEAEPVAEADLEFLDEPEPPAAPSTFHRYPWSPP